jgi:hypothetical protein
VCVAVYLSSPARLPPAPWRDEAPAFHVREAAPDDPVRAIFAWPNVYYAGAHEKCGCGFEADSWTEPVNPADAERRRTSLASLRRYVSDAIRLGPAQLFVCWEGEQGLPATARRTATLGALDGDPFEFEQRTLLDFRVRLQVAR